MGLNEFIEFYRPGWNEAIQKQRLLELPLPPSLAYAYGKLTHPPGEGLPMPPSITPPGTMGPPGGMDLPYEKPPSTIGELVTLLGPMKTMEELSSPKYMKLGESILATGRGGKREIIAPPPQPKYSLETDIEGGRHEVRYGLPDEPPLTRSVGGFPLKPPETPETWEPPYAGPGGSLLQKSSRGKVGSVLGRLGEGAEGAAEKPYTKQQQIDDLANYINSQRQALATISKEKSIDVSAEIEKLNRHHRQERKRIDEGRPTAFQLGQELDEYGFYLGERRKHPNGKTYEYRGNDVWVQLGGTEQRGFRVPRPSGGYR